MNITEDFKGNNHINLKIIICIRIAFNGILNYILFFDCDFEIQVLISFLLAKIICPEINEISFRLQGMKDSVIYYE